MVMGEDENPPRLVRPPKWLVQAIHDRNEYDSVRHLDGIVTSPTMRHDGTILQTQGYDPQSKLIYLPNATYPIVPNEPSRSDAVHAAQKL